MTVRMLRSRARKVARRLVHEKTLWHVWTAREQSLFMMGVGVGYGWTETETARLADAVSNLMLGGEF